jgi:tetratricopeptide (TPR) repeat protein
MTARARVLATVSVAAAVAAAGTVTVTWLQTRGETTQPAGAVTKPRAGAPPLTFDFGVRGDAQAKALASGAALLGRGRRSAALAIFSRYDSVDAQIGAAFARWPGGGLDTLKRLVSAHPASAAAQLHLGWALLWTGRVADAVRQFQRVERAFPDRAEAVVAEDVLYPKLAPGLPYVILGLALPHAPTAAAQLRLLERAARAGDADAKLRYGLALWSLRRRVSAERQFAAAAALAPANAVAQTAAAIGTFTKRDPVRAFSRLGPLTGRFPHAAVVRLHLGIALLWTGRIAKAASQFRLALADGPHTPFATAANELLSAVSKNGTKVGG